MPDIFNHTGYSIKRGSPQDAGIDYSQENPDPSGGKFLQNINEYQKNPKAFKKKYAWDPYVVKKDGMQCEEEIRIPELGKFVICWQDFHLSNNFSIWVEEIYGIRKYYGDLDLIDTDALFDWIPDIPIIVLLNFLRLPFGIINFVYEFIMKTILGYQVVQMIPDISMLNKTDDIYHYTTKKLIQNTDDISEGAPFDGLAIDRSISGQIKKVYKFEKGELINEGTFDELINLNDNFKKSVIN